MQLHKTLISLSGGDFHGGCNPVPARLLVLSLWRGCTGGHACPLCQSGLLRQMPVGHWRQDADATEPRLAGLRHGWYCQGAYFVVLAASSRSVVVPTALALAEARLDACCAILVNMSNPDDQLLPGGVLFPGSAK